MENNNNQEQQKEQMGFTLKNWFTCKCTGTTYRASANR